MKKRILSGIILGVSIFVIVGGFCLSFQQKALADKMIRLHVVANSDSEIDQTRKRQVRDAVLKEAQAALQGREQDPRGALQERLPQIQQAANRCLRQNGSSGRATVSLGKELFPTRSYETFSLPSGTYTSLRVTIGEGAGHNWWCVVFPSICMTASMDEMEQAAQAAGLTDGEIKLITEDSDGYVLKFRCMELLQKLKALF